MVMTVQPLQDTIQAARGNDKHAHVIYLSPRGKLLNQAGLTHLLNHTHLILVAGRYEGIDERLIELEIDETWSIGDYVLSGGELASMVMLDALTRLLPGALGHEESAQQDSFTTGLFDWPHYTRPEKCGKLAVPDVLLSGNHRAIARWRLKQALGNTWLHRPELLSNRSLTDEEQQLLDEFIHQQHEKD